MPNFLGQLIAGYKPVRDVDPITGEPVIKRPNFFQGLLTGGDAYRQFNNLQQALAMEKYRQQFEQGQGITRFGQQKELANLDFTNAQRLAAEQAKRAKEQTLLGQRASVMQAQGLPITETTDVDFVNNIAPFIPAIASALGRNNLGAQDLRSQQLNNEMQIAADPLSVRRPLSALQTGIDQDRAMRPMLQAQASMSPSHYTLGMGLEQDLLRSQLEQAEQLRKQREQELTNAKLLAPYQLKLLEGQAENISSEIKPLGGAGFYDPKTRSIISIQPGALMDSPPIIRRLPVDQAQQGSQALTPVDVVSQNGISGRIYRKPNY